MASAAPSAKIIAGLSCNVRCGFCVEIRRSKTTPDKTTEQVARELAQARRAGARRVDLLGGELTIRKDLRQLVGFARRIGFEEVMLTTNGVALSRPGAAAALLRSGVTELRLSLHGCTPAEHDAETGAPGSFRKLLAALKALRRLGFPGVATNTTVTRRNLRSLVEIVSLVDSLGVRRANLIYAGSGTPEDFEAHTPPISEAAPFLRRALERSRDGLSVRALNLPMPCRLWDLRDRLDDFVAREESYVEVDEPEAYRRLRLDSRVACRPVPACARCSARPDCPGPQTLYVEHFGDAEVLPI